MTDQAPETKLTVPDAIKEAMATNAVVATPAIMKCSLGGFVVVIPEKGIMAASTLEEVMMILDDHIRSELGEPHPQMPSFMDKAAGQDPRGVRNGNILSAIAGALVIATAAILGAKIG